MIRVRLLQDIDLNRKKGDIVEVAEEYGRKYLIKNKLAVRFQDEEKHSWDPQELSEKESLDKIVVLNEFRRQMYQGGVRKWSVNGLNRVFDQVDRESHDETLDHQEFEEAINKFGVFLNKRSILTLFRAFDVSGDGRIDYNEFLAGLRGAMNERRYLIVKKAWEGLPKIDRDTLSIEEISRLAGPKNHPSVIAGLCTVEEISKNLSDGLARAGDGSVVDESAFVKHFTDLSAAIDSDEIFVTMVCKQFGISEKDADAETLRLVDTFRKQLLQRIDQKAIPGQGMERTFLRVFQFVNSDSVGPITMAEFRSAMEMFGYRGQVVQQVFDYFDRSGNGTIDYHEFIAGMLGDEKR